MDHRIKDCPDRKEEAKVSEEESDDEDEEEAEEAFAGEEFCGIAGLSKAAATKLARQFALAMGSPLRTSRLHAFSIGIDSMCSKPIFMEASLVSNIRPCAGRSFEGIGGRIEVKHMADHQDFGRVYYRKPSKGQKVINLLSLGWLGKQPGMVVRYEQDEGRMMVETPTGKVYEFATDGGDLFICDLSD
jgi:hypothetical protein